MRHVPTEELHAANIQLSRLERCLQELEDAGAAPRVDCGIFHTTTNIREDLSCAWKVLHAARAATRPDERQRRSRELKEKVTDLILAIGELRVACTV